MTLARLLFRSFRRNRVSRAQLYKHKVLPKKHPFLFEPLEPRLLLSADLTYAPLATPPPLTQEGITGYLASVVSTNYTLRAENDSGTLFWRLYGTGTDLVPIPPTQVLQQQIDDFGDLDVNVKRDDLGATDIVAGLSLIDFVGDKLTVDLDSLSVLDGQFGGTTIDIDFTGGKDIDIGTILGIGPLPVPLANDQLIVIGNGGTFNNHPLKIHSTSDIVNDPSGVQIIASSDVELKSDSTLTINGASAITASNISLLVEATGSPLVKGLLANASGKVTVNSATSPPPAAW